MVVIASTVKVVHILTLLQWTTELLLHNIPMLPHPACAATELFSAGSAEGHFHYLVPVSPIAHRTDWALMLVMAGCRAKPPDGLLLPHKSLPAVLAYVAAALARFRAVCGT